ncbi:hypothetical protein LCGC14_0295940 [marine sediment metagenome]|uniref:DUF4203 domain-containing protein n=1 Tax=marine sediment metagenome TaxID=412755 RepID=A0A0F9TWW3_9ZZZZ|nr:hypothetical protein [Phycisphaerae bacterium]HDZ44181.1 hypothetical protein [Phycisphaerae bacterium]
MENGIHITIPQFPPTDWASSIVALLALGCLVVGALLIWKGYRLSRYLLAAAGGALGWALLPMLQEHVNAPWAIMIVTLVGMGAVLAFVMARVILAAAAGALVGGAALYWILENNIAKIPDGSIPSFQLPTTGTPREWVVEFVDVGQQYVGAGWNEKALVPLAVLAGAVLVPLILALFLKRLSAVLIMSVLGSIALVGAVACLLQVAGKTTNPAGVVVSTASLATIAALTVLGILLQFLGMRKAPEEGDDDKTDQD